MLNSTAFGVPRFSMTRDRRSSATRRSSLPKLARACNADTTILSFLAVRTIRTLQFATMKCTVHFSRNTAKRKGTAEAVPFISSAFSVTPRLRGKNPDDRGGRPHMGRVHIKLLVSYSIHERAQLARSGRMTQLAQRFGFDLADTFAGDREALPDFFQRVLAAILEAEAHLDDFLFARGQRAQDLSCLVLQVHVDHRFRRRNHRAVFDEVSQMRIFLFANRRFERDRLLRDLEHLAHFCHWNIHALGDLFRRRLASQFLHQLTRSPDQLVDGFDHVHRDADGARLVGNRAGDGLPNPPRGIRRKLVATAVFEFVDGLHQANVAFLNQVEELQAAVGVFFRNRNDQAEVGLNQFALGLLRVHVALDDLALRALELLEQHAGFEFEFFDFGADRPRLTPIFLLLLFAASSVGLALQVRGLAVERAHAVDGFVQAFDQPLALGIGECEFANGNRSGDDRASQLAPRPAVIFRLLGFRNFLELLFEDRGLFVQLGHVVDLAGELIQAVLQDLVGDLFFVEGHDFLDRANVLLEVFAQGEQFADHDGRSRERLEHTDLTAFNALGDFHFAFAREQGHGSHLAQIHADGIVGFFQSSGSEVEFDVLPFFVIFEFFIESSSGRQFGAFQDVDALRANRSQQIVEVFGTVHVMRYEVIDLVIREISLLFACIDQLFYVVVLVIKSQEVSLNCQLRSRGACGKVPCEKVGNWVKRDCAASTNLSSLARKSRLVYRLPALATRPRLPDLPYILRWHGKPFCFKHFSASWRLSGRLPRGWGRARRG